MIRAGLILFILLWAGSFPLRAQAQTSISKEYQIKAVFLFNFAQFVSWPEKVFASPNEPFCIGVLGDDPFGSFLDETVKGEKVESHPLIIRRYQRVEDVKNCQILFISRSEMDQIEHIFAQLKDKSILTVGDAEGFIQKGGILRFASKENKIHLRINPKAAKRVNLSISSKVLRLAEIVEPGKE
jgi:hypothetical protein